MSIEYEYKIKRILVEDVHKVAELYNICFSREKNTEFFRWKYFENPVEHAKCSIALHGEKIVGSCVLIPEDFFVFGKNMRVYKCCDLMTHPQHRKRGLSTKLINDVTMTVKQSGPVFFYTLCSKNATGAFLKNKWVMSAEVRYHFKHISQIKLQVAFRKLIKRKKNIGNIRVIDSISDLYNGFKIKHTNNGNDNIQLYKDEKYLKWRLGNPFYNYCILGYFQDDAIKGYLIYNKGINNNIFIIDLETKDNNLQIANLLLNHLESIASENNKSVLALTIKDTYFQKLIQENGYICNPFRRGPLTSILDFNVFIDEDQDRRSLQKEMWSIHPLNYDDV
ncbi:MAG: GNAT family N-acetyltransferase [Oligoflexia bacterium]|nr:GNAT family N-acetyltransferase [Oligoflexia bacterium]